MQSGKLSLLNAKEISYLIIDGDVREPYTIAKEKGMLGSGNEVDFTKIIAEVIATNKTTVDKIKESGKDGPIMFLVGQVMKKTNKQGDPQEILKLIKAFLGLK